MGPAFLVGKTFMGIRIGTIKLIKTIQGVPKKDYHSNSN